MRREPAIPDVLIERPKLWHVTNASYLNQRRRKKAKVPRLLIHRKKNKIIYVLWMWDVKANFSRKDKFRHPAGVQYVCLPPTPLSSGWVNYVQHLGTARIREPTPIFFVLIYDYTGIFFLRWLWSAESSNNSLDELSLEFWKTGDLRSSLCAKNAQHAPEDFDLKKKAER